MVKAIALAFQWRKLQESGTHETVEEIAAAEKINEAADDAGAGYRRGDPGWTASKAEMTTATCVSLRRRPFTSPLSSKGRLRRSLR